MNSTGLKVRKPGKNRINPTVTAAGGKMRPKTLDHIDGRTIAARRAHELIAAMSRDLTGSDDDSQLTEGTKQLIRAAAVLGSMIESEQACWLGGDKIDMASYFAALNTQRRILVVLGLSRRVKDVTPPSVESYLNHVKQQEKGEDIEQRVDAAAEEPAE